MTSSTPTSRLIVKNLPKYCTPEMLRKHFSTHPSSTITDLRLSYTPDGKFRRFAFVGFASEGEAEGVKRHFDGTYFDTMKMQVESAIPVGDSALPRPWSKYTKSKTELQQQQQQQQQQQPSPKESSTFDAELEKKRKFLFSIYGDAGGNAEEVGELERYLNAMRPKSQTKTWENDDGAAVDSSLIDPKTGAKLKKRVKVAVQSVKVRKAGGEGLTVPKVHMKFDEEEEEVEFEKSEDEDLYEDFPVQRPESSVMMEDTTKLDSNNASNPVENDHLLQERNHPILDPAVIAESGRLFVRNLSYACTESDLEALFSPFGPISSIHLPIAGDTKKMKGFAYVLFTIPDDAVRAFTELDGKVFQGRLLHVLPAHEQKSQRDSITTSPGNFKSQKEAELKASAGSAHNWNSLFIRSDTVLDAVAARLGVPKSSIMDTSAGRGDLSLATRLAVAETHIIQETKEYLESQGVILDAFTGKPSHRSNLVILVKNLPFSVNPDDLRKQFARFGALKRFIIPSTTRSMALVEFLEANEAKAAFRGLAYTKFEAAPLFLEWAPMDCLKEAESVVMVKRIEEGNKHDPLMSETAMGTTTTTSTATPTDTPTDTDTHTDTIPLTLNLTLGYCLFVKNLSFTSTEDGLSKLFSSIAPLRSVRIPRKAGGLSMGFGFVEFNNRDDLNRALDKLQGVVLDGHALQLKLQSGKNEPVIPASSKKRNQLQLSETELESLRPCKLLLKNIPFEANERELRALITSFTPSLKRLRLPKKFDGGLRGFGFAEFGTHAEAKHLMEQLGATHFYGRHLVIEWAKSDDAKQA